MEVFIFKKNEITEKLWDNLELFSIKEYSDPCELKLEIFGNFKDLDQTKARIDTLDKKSEYIRRAAAKYLHEYELVKIICKKQVISRAYFKLYEIIYYEPIILNKILNCFFICEAPGGFIECICDIRRRKNLLTNFISVSKNDESIKYGHYIEESCLFYSDITNPIHIVESINKTLKRFPNGLDLITADGGFDVKIFNGQEILTSKLLLCEIYIALKTQKIGGMFIIKFFDMFTHNSIVYYLLLCTFYDYVKIIKPKTSRNCNSERYLVCYTFHGSCEKIIHEIWEMIINFKIRESVITNIYPNFNFNVLSLKKITTFNNLVLYEQIKTINESIKMVLNKNGYFQNLLLNIFLESKYKINIFVYKNILSSRIKKCINFLRNYNININVNYIA